MSGGDISLKYKVPKAVERGFREAPELAEKALYNSVLEAEMLLEREVKELPPVGIGAGGGLRGSVSAREPQKLADNIIGEVGTSLLHALPVELGTKPHMPPIQPLVDWAAQKLNLPPVEAERAGFLIAMKIKAKGTKGVHMFERAFKANENQVSGFFERNLEWLQDQIGGRA